MLGTWCFVSSYWYLLSTAAVTWDMGKPSAEQLTCQDYACQDCRYVLLCSDCKYHQICLILDIQIRVFFFSRTWWKWSKEWCTLEIPVIIMLNKVDNGISVVMKTSVTSHVTPPCCWQERVWYGYVCVNATYLGYICSSVIMIHLAVNFCISKLDLTRSQFSQLGQVNKVSFRLSFYLCA